MASAVDTATPLSGTGLLDDGAQLVHAIESGDWLAGGLSAFAVGVDTVAAVSDPLGSLIASGLGWLIDHLEPIKGWFDDLTGNAGEVEAFAATWTNIQTQLQVSGAELTRRVTDLDSLAGEAIDAYRRFQADAAAHLAGAASWAGAMATGLRVASQVVQLVHDLVRDVLSQLVGSAISWAAEAVFSLGLATPWIIEQVSTRVASWVAKIGTKLTELLTACKKLAGLLGALHGLISKAGALFENALRKTAPAVRRTVAGDQGELNLDELMSGKGAEPKGVAARGLTGEQIDGAIDSLCRGADLLRNKNGLRQYNKPGDYTDAARDFQDLTVGLEVVEYPNGTKVAVLIDGTTVNVRGRSSAGPPTLEMQRPSGTANIKVRYQ
ncbi:hypothetical protein [Microbacterium mangrovi]|uniref:hypothetical protein n=1 Tax=Microbacterium mangrovi TaxID=1348253 RepID=UPI0012E01B57|nr:hypothetical protein [Microbacterium mangrovi]